MRIRLLLVAMLVLTGCSSLQDLDESQLEAANDIWVNQLGIVLPDARVWQGRLATACGLGVWERGIARQLAEQYVEVDMEFWRGMDDVARPSIDDGAVALWLMAIQVCRDDFPLDVIDAGPGYLIEG